MSAWDGVAGRSRQVVTAKTPARVVVFIIDFQ